MPKNTITAFTAAMARGSGPPWTGTRAAGVSMTPGMSTPCSIFGALNELLGEREQLRAVLVLARVILPHGLGHFLPFLECGLVEVGDLGALLCVDVGHRHVVGL